MHGGKGSDSYSLTPEGREMARYLETNQAPVNEAALDQPRQCAALSGGAWDYGLQCAQNLFLVTRRRFCVVQSTNSCLLSEQILIWV